MIKSLKQEKGFTIIEVMISLGLFIVIMIIGVGALINANNVHKKNQKIRSILDNLSFVMEDMSRNMRTGTEFNCSPGFSPNCADGKSIKFTNNNVVPTPELWQYDFVDALNPSYPGMGYIQKTTPSGTNILNPDEVKFDGNSGFIVIGAPLGSADHIQPYIIIKFSGFIYYKNELVTPFYLETAVSQRLIDTLP